MATPKTYDNLERPYNNLLERDAQDISDVSPKGENTSSAGATGDSSSDVFGGVGGGVGGANGSVESMSVKSDGSMGDVWIKNFIRSENWKPKSVGFNIDGQTGHAEFTDVYISGEVEALTGLIGGFTIGATDLSVTDGGDTTILSSGAIAFSAGPTGAPTVTITQEGILNASEANITGAIIANSGSIGSFTIGTYLYTGAKTTYNDSNAGIHLGADGIGIANNLFTVSAAGVVTAVSGTLGGWTLAPTTLSATGIVLDSANQKITVGSGSEITIDGVSKKIESSNYVSGVFGAGFYLDSNLLEVGNIAARGLIRTAVFQKDVISVVGGNLVVLDGDVLDEDMSALDDEILVTKGNSTFAIGDILRIKDGVDDEWMEVIDAPS